MGIEHHHGGHHFGDRRHRAHQIRLAGINDFFRGQIDDHAALPEAISGCEAVTAVGVFANAWGAKGTASSKVRLSKETRNFGIMGILKSIFARYGTYAARLSGQLRWQTPSYRAVRPCA
ncbi:hypothetical protein LNQ03_02405 [Klebsiella pneumoniae subsp. pneumoniae]|nr:hypothetical protein [Klebsiella pneumoniae subsp. pneumoniae]